MLCFVIKLKPLPAPEKAGDAGWLGGTGFGLFTSPEFSNFVLHPLSF